MPIYLQIKIVVIVQQQLMNKMLNKMKSKILILFVLTTLVFNSFAQNENLEEQTITIYNEYNPVLRDANRIQTLPVIVDTAKITNSFSYNANPTIFKTTYIPEKLSIATLKGETLKPLNNGMIKLGIGIPLTPYIEGFYNNKRNADYSFGAYFKHHSTHGKTKNKKFIKIYNGFANTLGKIYAKKFFPSATLSADLGFSSDIINFYGYDPKLDTMAGIFAPRDKSEMEDFNIMRFMANVDLSSNSVRKNRFDYNLNVAYKYLFTNKNLNSDYNNFQNIVNVHANLNKTIKIHRFGADIDFSTAQMKIDSLGKSNNMFLVLNPYYKIYAKNWQFRAGVNITGEFIPSDSTKKFHFYPNVLLQHNIGNTYIAYAGMKGYLERNDLDNIARKNQFINVFNTYQNTNFAQVIEIGFKGYPTNYLYFNINGGYSKIDNMPYFVNDTSITLQNKFLMEYANTERFSGYAEIAFHDFYNFTISLSGHYYYYHYVKEEYENQFLKPWHSPSFDVSLIASYKIIDNLNVGINFQLIGPRYAREYELTETDDGFGNIVTTKTIVAKKLKTIADISLFAEYEIFNNFSAFLEINNITAQKQYYWNNYQSYGFNVLGGIKYVF